MEKNIKLTNFKGRDGYQKGNGIIFTFCDNLNSRKKAYFKALNDDKN